MYFVISCVYVSCWDVYISKVNIVRAHPFDITTLIHTRHRKYVYEFWVNGKLHASLLPLPLHHFYTITTTMRFDHGLPYLLPFSKFNISSVCIISLHKQTKRKIWKNYSSRPLSLFHTHRHLSSRLEKISKTWSLTAQRGRVSMADVAKILTHFSWTKSPFSIICT